MKKVRGKMIILGISAFVAMSGTTVTAHAATYNSVPVNARGTWHQTTGHYQGKLAGEVVTFSTHKVAWHGFPTGTGNIGTLPKMVKVHGWYRANLGHFLGWSKSDYMYFRRTNLAINGKKQPVLLWNVGHRKLVSSAMVFTHGKTMLTKSHQKVIVRRSGSFHY